MFIQKKKMTMKKEGYLSDKIKNKPLKDDIREQKNENFSDFLKITIPNL